MPRPPHWIHKKLGPLTLWRWLAITLVVLAGAGAIALLFVRRDVIEFRPEHTFNVHAPEFFGSAHAMADPVVLEGNKIDLLHNGDQIFPAMLEAIRGARKSVNFEAFLFNSGTVGSQFRDAFIDRARAGVRVRVLLDGIGSGASLENEDVRAMEEAGVHFAYFHATRSWRIDRSNRRTHRRVLVVDGRVGFTGGAGFADHWLGNADTKDHWREVHARIEGPLVAKLQGAFQQHWAKETQQALLGADEFPLLEPAGKLRAQLIASHEYSIAPLPMTQAVAIAAAEKTIWITNPYCMPSEDQVKLLVAAVKRGVQVRLLVPGPHNDQPATKAAGRTAYGKLLEGEVEIYEYQPTMIHAKTMVVDGMFSIFGSSNLDARSAQINEELDITVWDEGFGAQMNEVFERDLARSRRYTLAEFRKRTLWERVTEWLAQPLRSQL